MTDNLPRFAGRMPKRIQRSRAKGWRKPEGAVIVDRTSRWGNPFTVKQAVDVGLFKMPDQRAARYVVHCFDDWLRGDRSQWVGSESDAAAARILDNICKLRGKDLVCWCPLDQPCHADVLLRLANEQPRKCQVCGVTIPGCDICGTESNDETCDWCEECAG